MILSSGPARRIAAATGAILLLTVVAVAVVVWRYDQAVVKEREASRVVENGERILGELRENLAQRSALVAAYAATGDAPD